jgi:hypothetical protein
LIVRNAPIGLQSFLGYFAQNYIGLTRIQQEDGANAFLPLNQSQSPQNVSSDFESEHSYPIQFGIPSPRPSTPSMATTVEWDLPIVRQPRFSIKFWNINERVRSSLFRTNNSLESAHLQFGKGLNHHPSLSAFLQAVLNDIDKQLDIARAAVLQQKRMRRRRYVLQEQHIMETLEGAQYDLDEDLLDLLTLLGLQIQGYVNGLRDNTRGDSDDNDEP